MAKKPIVLEIKNLRTEFRTEEGIVHAVNGVNLYLREGETLAIVGESGCGKSVSMLSTMRLIPDPPGRIVGGEVTFRDKKLFTISEDEMRGLRGSQIAMIFQDPMTSLNPVLTIGYQLREPLLLHLGMNEKDANARAVELMELVGIPEAEARLNDYPHQFSGGMRQRVMIAMALTCSPQILIADEPTTALDVTIQAQIVELVKRLRDELGMAIIWITHDLGVVAGIAQRVMVMYGGYIIEEALVEDLYASPSHPYTIGLLASLPRIDETGEKTLETIEGMPPILLEISKSCPFAPRCKWVQDKCREKNPLLTQINNDHSVACWVDIKTGKLRK